MTDQFRAFSEKMLAEISKPRSFEETTFAIERLAQQRVTPIDAEPVAIAINTPTFTVERVWQAEAEANAPGMEAIAEALRQQFDALLTTALAAGPAPATVGTLTADKIEPKPRPTFCGALSFDVTS